MKYNRYLLLPGLILALGISCVIVAVIREVQGISGSVVDAKSNVPISMAQVYLHTSRGIPLALDRNQYYTPTTTDRAGHFCFPAPKGRYEGIYGIGDGYYPGFANEKRRIALTAVPAGPLLPIREGMVRIDADGSVWGFCFATGSLVPAAEADVIPSVPAERAERISALQAVEAGGLSPILHDEGEGGVFARDCAFLSACIAPAAGYEKSVEGTEYAYLMCYVRCADGRHFAKLDVYTSSYSDHREMLFIYVYQPEESRVLPAEFGAAQFKSWFALYNEEAPRVTTDTDVP